MTRDINIEVAKAYTGAYGVVALLMVALAL
jgi:hypothetical protein